MSPIYFHTSNISICRTHYSFHVHHFSIPSLYISLNFSTKVPYFSSISLYLDTYMKPKEDESDHHKAKKVFAGHFVIKEKKKTELHEEVVKYKECRKNHAASLGRYAVDGCCEFMPAGEEGSAAALSCHACSCHRNFHKREAEIELQLHFSLS